MEAFEGPKQSEAAVDVRARTAYGDVIISRSPWPQQNADRPKKSTTTIGDGH
jgi:hypothetical protein